MPSINHKSSINAIVHRPSDETKHGMGWIESRLDSRYPSSAFREGFHPSTQSVSRRLALSQRPLPFEAVNRPGGVGPNPTKRQRARFMPTFATSIETPTPPLLRRSTGSLPWVWPARAPIKSLRVPPSKIGGLGGGLPPASEQQATNERSARQASRLGTAAPPSLSYSVGPGAASHARSTHPRGCTSQGKRFPQRFGGAGWCVAP